MVIEFDGETLRLVYPEGTFDPDAMNINVLKARVDSYAFFGKENGTARRLTLTAFATRRWWALVLRTSR